MKKKLLAISNIIGFVAVVFFNYLAVMLPIGGKTTGELANMYPNLFVPAGLTFSIWGLIYLLLCGFVTLQAVDAYKKTTKHITQQMGVWFLLSCLANIGRIFAWHYQQIFLSMGIMIILLLILIIINTKTHTGHTSKTGREKLLVQTTFSVYLGWISVATIANMSALLVHTGRDMRGMSDVFRTIVIILVATFLAIWSLIRNSSIPFALVVIWAFVGIIIKRVVDPIYASSIIWTLGCCISVITGFIGLKFEKRMKS